MRTFKKYWPIFLFIPVLTLSIFFRVVNLHADPPTEHFLEAGDEGTHSYAARQLYLTGNWAPDGVYFGGIMPIYPILQIGGVILLGVHNYAFRAINVFTSLLTIVLIYWFLKKEMGLVSALVGLSSLGLGFLFTLYSKTGLPEATMIFFSTCAFIAFYYSVTAKKRFFLQGITTGVFVLLAFFTKQSSLSLIGLVVITWSILFVREYLHRKVINNKFLIFAAGFLSITIILLTLYVAICVLPSAEKWLTNIPTIIGGNRPRKALLQIPYLLEQIKLTIFNPLWMYLHIVTVGTFSALLLVGLKLSNRLKHNRRDILVNLAALWFCLFIIYMIAIPLKAARFYLLIIIPMTILYASLFQKENWQLLKAKIGSSIGIILCILIVAELVINIGYNYWYFVVDPQFQVLESTSKLARYVPRNTLSNLPVHWIMNDTFRNINTFMTPITDLAIQQYYDRYGWPAFMVILNYQNDLYRQQSPKFFQMLQYVTVINGYTLYKVTHP